MSQPPIRVLHVLGALNPGGVETWLMNVLRHIDRSKFQLDFCTFGPEKGVFAAEAESLGSTVHSCPMQEGTLSLGRRFRKIVRGGKYDVVHSHVHHFSGAVLRWAHKENVPMRISHSHSSSDGKQPTVARRAYRWLMVAGIRRYATHCLAASQAAARSLYGQHWEFSARARVLHNGIDLLPFRETVDAQAIRTELRLPLGVPIIGHIGRFAEPKNHAFLIQIAREVISQRPDFHFLLIGDGPLRPRIEEQVKNAGLCKSVSFAGMRNDVPRLLLGAVDLFLFPSLWEGLPVALVEAQAAGLPCVISDRVTQEACICKALIKTLSLSRPPSSWAEAIIESCVENKERDKIVLPDLSGTAFDIACNNEDLSALYGRI